MKGYETKKTKQKKSLNVLQVDSLSHSHRLILSPIIVILSIFLRMRREK